MPDVILQDVKKDFLERVEEIEKYFSLLDDIIVGEARLCFLDNTKKSVDKDLTATLKSAGVLLLYNLVESVVTNSLFMCTK